MLPMIPIGPLAVQTPGLVLVLGFWLALGITGRQGTRPSLDGSAIQDAGFYGALAGIVGARLGYLVQYWPIYRENLLGIVSLNSQTLSPTVGLVVGVLVAAIYLQRKEVAARPLLDAIAPGLAVFVAALALANLAGGTAFGIETDVPWAIELWDARRHPTQLYELTAGLVLLSILLRIGRKVPAPGLGFLFFVASYSGLRLLLEPLRANSQIMAGGLRTTQVVGLVVMMAALTLMRVWFDKITDRPFCL